MGWLAGVDGCKGGWIAAAAPTDTLDGVRILLVRRFRDLDARVGGDLRIAAIDIPIGLSSEGPREADMRGRALLGSRGSTVFASPERATLEYARSQGFFDDARIPYRQRYGKTHEFAVASFGHGVAPHAFGIYEKIDEIDRYLTSTRDGRLFEAHPEVAFARMNGGDALASGKRAPDGRAARTSLLREALSRSSVDVRPVPFQGVHYALDDLYDALSLLWVARRIAQGVARPIPDPPPKDSVGLPMAIWT